MLFKRVAGGSHARSSSPRSVNIRAARSPFLPRAGAGFGAKRRRMRGAWNAASSLIRAGSASPTHPAPIGANPAPEPCSHPGASDTCVTFA